MLGSRNTAHDALAGRFPDELATAACALCRTGRKPDFDIRSQITGATYYAACSRTQPGPATVHDIMPCKVRWLARGQRHQPPLTWFLRPDGGSSRAGRNREWVGDAIRAARPRMHEWVPASDPDMICRDHRGHRRALSRRWQPGRGLGVANFIEFQNEVRTPTTDLVFKPGSFAEVSSATLPHHLARAHDLSGKGYSLTPPNRPASIRPRGRISGRRCRSCKPMPAACAPAPNAGAGLDPCQNASPRWHQCRRASPPRIGDNVAMRAMAEVRDAILGFLPRPSGSDSPDLSDTRADLYQQAGSSAIAAMRRSRPMPPLSFSATTTSCATA